MNADSYLKWFIERAHCEHHTFAAPQSSDTWTLTRRFQEPAPEQLQQQREDTATHETLQKKK